MNSVVPLGNRQLGYIGIVALLLLLLPFAKPVWATETEALAKGLEIAQERKRRDMGWQDAEAQMVMLLRNSYGTTSEREMRVMSLEVQDDGDKSLVVFDTPRDISGTALLTYAHVVGADDQWLYMPALKRVKRIASKNKSGPFVGSDFAYEDMVSFEVNKFTHRFLRTQSIEGVDYFVVEQVPRDNLSGYTRQVLWLDQEHLRVMRAEFYDKKSALLKVLVLSDYQQHLDHYWRAHRLHMHNVQTGSETTLSVSAMHFKTGLSESSFSQNGLKRIR